MSHSPRITRLSRIFGLSAALTIAGCATGEVPALSDNQNPDTPFSGSVDAGADASIRRDSGGSPVIDSGGPPPVVPPDAGIPPKPLTDADVVPGDPIVTSIVPTSLPIGSGAASLAVVGTNFVAGTQVRFDSVDLVTTFISSTRLDAIIPAAQLAIAGSFTISVVTPSGAAAAAPIAFTVVAGAPFIASISPTSAVAGSDAIDVTVIGTNLDSALIQFDGVAAPTSSLPGSLERHATLTAAQLKTGKTILVSAVRSGSGTSNTVPFDVINSTPTLTSIAPTVAAPGSPPVNVTVTGTGFSGSSVVVSNGVDLATVFTSGTSIVGTIPATQLSALGTLTISVRNPPPGGGTTPTTETFTVANPVPIVTSMAPTGVVAGSPLTEITLTGTGFVATTKVHVDGVAITTRYISLTRLSADIPAAKLVAVGSRIITVVTPAPGGGTSAPSSFNVVSAGACPDTAGVDTILGAPGTVHEKTLDLATAPTSGRLSDNGTCPTVLSGIVTPYRAYVVQNTLISPVVLSAWALCTSSEDAYLAFYRRGTVPTVDAERLQCFGQVSEGRLGGNLDSPEAGTSSWCPGLTKTNGGGITLAACEKAVVYLQMYAASNSFSAWPTTMKIKAELP